MANNNLGENSDVGYKDHPDLGNSWTGKKLPQNKICKK